MGFLAAFGVVTVAGVSSKAGVTALDQTPQTNLVVHTVETEYQKGPRRIEVLLPDSYDRQKTYPVLYVLPVTKGYGNQGFDDALQQLKGMNAHNTHAMIIVQMEFEKTPWYGDHANDPKVRQASYLKDFVVPFIERIYSTPGTKEGRLLFGFSKGGWGAFSLILKYPDFFGYAAAWDAPLLFNSFYWDMQDVYGTQAQLDAYRPDLLAPSQKAHFQKRPRLVLAGETYWGTMVPAPKGGSHTVEFHDLLASNGMLHHYNDALPCKHTWNKGWMQDTLEALMKLTDRQFAQ